MILGGTMTEVNRKKIEPILRVCKAQLSKNAYQDLINALEPGAELVREHNSVVHDARNALAMLSAKMSAVKGAPTAEKVAIWRDDIARTLETFKLLRIEQ